MDQLPSELLLEIAILLPDPKPFRQLCHRFSRVCPPKVYWKQKALRCLSITTEEWSLTPGDSSYAKYCFLAHVYKKQQEVKHLREYNCLYIKYHDKISELKAQLCSIEQERDVILDPQDRLLRASQVEGNYLRREYLCARGQSRPKLYLTQGNDPSWHGLRIEEVEPPLRVKLSEYDIVCSTAGIIRFIVWRSGDDLVFQKIPFDRNVGIHYLPYRCLSLLDRFGITKMDDIRSLYGPDCFTHYQDEKRSYIPINGDIDDVD